MAPPLSGMRARGTLILLVLFALVGGYALLVERHRPSPEEREKTERVILDLDPAAITEIRWVRGDAVVALERRKGNAWQIVEPRRTAADEGAASALAGIFDKLEAERWLKTSEMDTTATGLSNPWLRVVVQATDSLRTVRHELAVGSPNPAGDAYFARLDAEPRIALLSSWLVDSNLKKSFSDLRDKRLVHFDPEAARRIEIRSPSRRLVLLENAGAWRLAEPPLPADETAVRSLLDRIVQLEAIEFIDESSQSSPPNLSYGLAAPQVTALVLGERDSLLARIEIGAVGDRGAYARAGGRDAPGAVVTVPPAAAEELAPEIETLRDKRLVDLGASEIDTLRVIAGSRVAVVCRDSSGAFGRGGASQDVEGNRVVSNLPYLRVNRFIDEKAPTPAGLRRYGLDTPPLRLLLRLRNGETQEVAFGNESDKEGVFAYRPGRPGVVLVTESMVSDFRRLLEPVQAGSAQNQH